MKEWTRASALMWGDLLNVPGAIFSILMLGKMGWDYWQHLKRKRKYQSR